jgi:transcriptional regulator with XRE-family HTH domain
VRNISIGRKTDPVKRVLGRICDWYTDPMTVGNLSHRERLADELRQIRREARLTQQGLASLSSVALTTIKANERGEAISKAETLRLLARGAATDGAGDLDPSKADAYYDRLMRAAGYLGEAAPPEEPRPVDDLTDEEVVDELERRFGNRDVAVSLLAASKNWRNLSPRSQRLILETVRYAAGEDDDEPTPARRSRR